MARRPRSGTGCGSTGTSRSRWTTGSSCVPTSSVPLEDGTYPVILSYGPYAKGLHFEDGYPDQWRIMCEQHPGRAGRLVEHVPNWEVVDPEKWVPHGYVCVRVDSRGAGRSPGYIQHFSPRETKDFYDCIEWAGVQPWSNGKVGLSRHLVLRHEPVAGRRDAAAAPGRDVRLGGRGRLVPRRRPTTAASSRPSGRTGTSTRSRRCSTASASNGPRSRVTGELVCGDETLDATRSWRANRADFGAGAARPPARSTTTTTARHPGLVEDHGAAALGRQLGRPRAAPARQHGRLRPRRPRSRSGSRCTASSTGRTTTPTTAARSSSASSTTS